MDFSYLDNWNIQPTKYGQLWTRKSASGSSSSEMSDIDKLVKAYQDAANMQAQGYQNAAGMISGAASGAAGMIGNALAQGQGFQQAGIDNMMALMERALGIQQSMYQAGVNKLKPWVKGGKWALSKLLPTKQRKKPGKKGYRPATPGLIEGEMPDTSAENYVKSPYYDFLLEQGIQARDRAAAARGMALSGAQQKAIEEYGQGLGKTDYDQWFNREWTNYFNKLLPYQQQSEAGRAAAAQQAQVGQNYANAASNILTGTGANVANVYNSMAGNALSGAGAQANMLMGGAGQAAGLLSNAANAQASGVFNSAYIPYQHNLYQADLARSREIANSIDDSRRRSDIMGVVSTVGPVVLNKALSYI